MKPDRLLRVLALLIGWMVSSGAWAQATQPALLVRVYDVRDLLHDDRELMAPRAVDEFGWPRANLGLVVPSPEAQRLQRDRIVARLVNRIQSQVDPDSWKPADPNAALDHPTVPSLRELHGQFVIAQTAENQQRIHDLLTALRNIEGLQVTVVTRFIQNPLPLDEGKWVHEAGYDRWPEPMTAAAVSEMLLRTQQKASSATLTAPRMTLFDKQRAYVTVGSETSYVADWKLKPAAVAPDDFEKVVKAVPTGLWVEIRPAVSADRTEVELEVGWHYARLRLLEERPHVGNGPVRATVQVPIRELLDINSRLTLGDGQSVLLRSAAKVDPPRPDIDPATPVYLLLTAHVIVQREIDAIAPTTRPAP